MFEIDMIGRFNPFEWDALKCPVCGRNKFVSLSHASIYCDYCNARFSVRDTAGDPGCVVDCIVEEENRRICGPAYNCPTCKRGFGSLKENPVCPIDPAHEIVRESSIFRHVDLPQDFPKRFYLILKTGDYCSGWMDGSNIYNKLVHPTQEEWNEFQKTYRINW